MSSAQLLKEYDLKKLEELCKDYRFLGIEDVNGKRIQGFNQHQTPIKDQFKKCVKRLQSEAVPEDFYFFCFANNPRMIKYPDKFLYRKGTPPKNDLSERMNHAHTEPTRNDLLSVTSALNYITQIAELKSEITRLTLENKYLTDEIAVLNAELAEAEREGALNDGEPKNNLLEFLKEAKPGLMSLADRFMDLEEKKLGLSEGKRKIKKIALVPGSEQHIKYMDSLSDKGNDNQLNIELDKLEKKNPELYAKLCEKYGFSEEEEEEEQS